ncbi:hypothetical protein Tco_0445977 [Tanacetum coccineum]|uniref:Uncharacterized protein n=1 Tax=Tanacetum coccineum TaxID=301880 RepID=A0ABQ5AMV4_9ASTR
MFCDRCIQFQKKEVEHSSFQWRRNKDFLGNSWANTENLSEYVNIYLELFVIQTKLIGSRYLDLLNSEPELLHVDFWYICSDSKGFEAWRSFDDILDNLESFFSLRHIGFNPHVFVLDSTLSC